jgi:DNA-binding beta-propeller fold protein YncE
VLSFQAVGGWLAPRKLPVIPKCESNFIQDSEGAQRAALQFAVARQPSEFPQTMVGCRHGGTMKLNFRLRQLLPGATLLLFTATVCAQDKSNPLPLQRVASIPLPGITGDFDHFAVDEKGGRLFLAGEDHKTLEVFELKTGKHIKSVGGFGTPHSVFYLPDSNRILVTDGEAGAVQILSGNDYSFAGKIDQLLGADSARPDPARQILYVVTGGKDVQLDHSFLVALDLKSNRKAGELRFESNHVEAFALDPSSSRLFINITDKGQVAVVDRQAMKEITRWPVGVAGENSPMIYDESHRRLLIVCRKPPMLVVMDADNGKVVANLPAAGRSDDIAFDPSTGRIYVPGGDGHISIFHQDSADNYSLIANVPTLPGSKTSLLVPSLERYFVAASPGETKAIAKLLIFQTRP